MRRAPASEIDAASVFLPVTEAGRLRALATTDFSRGCRLRRAHAQRDTGRSGLRDLRVIASGFGAAGDAGCLIIHVMHFRDSIRVLSYCVNEEP